MKLIPRSLLQLGAISIILQHSYCVDIDELIQFDDDLDNQNDPVIDPVNDPVNLLQEEEDVINLWQLQKPRWRKTLTKYDTNKDGKLSGDELILAYPEIEHLIKHGDDEPSWWEELSMEIMMPYLGVVLAVVMGGAILIAALMKLKFSSQNQTNSEISHSIRRQEWLDKLQNSNKAADSKSAGHDINSVEADSGDENIPRLHKRKPDATRDLVTSKMARYNQLSAVRRQPGNTLSANNNSAIYQQLLPDDDELAENSSDEIVGNTRKRRQIKNSPNTEIHQKILKDFASEEELIDKDVENSDDKGISEPKTDIQAAKDISSQIQPEIKTDNLDLEQPLEREQKVLEFNPEERTSTLLDILSNILDCKVVIAAVSSPTYSSQNRTLKLSILHLPSQTSDVEVKIPSIVKVMAVRQLDKVKYAITCFDRCLMNNDKQQDPVCKEACSFLLNHFSDFIIQVVDKDSVGSAGEDDLWSDYNTDVLSTPAQTLCRIAGWTDDQVFISLELLSRLLQHTASDIFLSNLLSGARRQLSSVKRVDEVILQEGRILRAVEILFSNSLCGEVLTRVLKKELEQSATGLGNFFENTSIVSPLLSLSTIPSKQKNQHFAATPFLQLPGFPRINESDIKLVETTIQEALHRCQNIVFLALKKVLSSKSSREDGLAWLAAVINLNDVRTAWSPDPESQPLIGCSDGFMLNFCAILIELFLPGLNSADLVNKVDLGYSTDEACRLNFDFEICLAGGQIVSEASKDIKIGVLPTEFQGKFNFLTECYHLCQRALSVGVIPAISHYNAIQRKYSQVLSQVKDTPQEAKVRHAHVMVSLMWQASLFDPEFVRKVSQFYLIQSQLILKMMDSANQTSDSVKVKKKLLSQIPEFCVRDMAVWFRFVAQQVVYVHQGVLAGLTLFPFVECCVELLSEPDLMPGPIASSKVVSALLAFVKSSQRQQVRNIGWNTNIISDLAMMVYTCPSVNEKLGPALIRIYVSVDVVEGLDVDKDEFDKFSSRAEISHLVGELWDRVDSRTSILNITDTKLFQDFLGSILDTLLYMLHDSLANIANVKKLQVAKDNVEEWNKLTDQEKADKEEFLRRGEKSAQGFTQNANHTLGFLDLLTKAEKVASCFSHQPLAYRAANAILGFLESLCGSKCKDYKVKNMEKYFFDPQMLLIKIVSVILRIADQDFSKTDGFVVSMATDADFSPPTLEKAHSVIARKQLAEEDQLNSFLQLIEKMKEIQSRRTSPTGEDNSFEWQTAITSLEINSEELKERYVDVLSDMKFDSSDLQESHSFNVNAQDLSVGSSKIKAMMKEIKGLQVNLPVHPDAAIFVRQDEERIDLMRALVTGPVDTPYSRGCFVFDVYFPNNYPNIPPLVKIITTGNGTVRFNPNLYSDGKVCLSLLGTWHAGNASEKWNSSTSSLYQVLVSIQSLILIPEPMFNEPGYEGIRGTTEFTERSKSYNSKIRLWTVRHAMLGQLRSPPAGFEEVVRQHFKLEKNVVLKQCSDWLNDCEDEEDERRLRSVVNSLREELEKLADNENSGT